MIWPSSLKTGYEGSVDCCLIITDGTLSKEFLIESPSWERVANLRQGASFPIIIQVQDPRHAEVSSMLYHEDTSADHRIS